MAKPNVPEMQIPNRANVTATKILEETSESAKTAA